jgi:RND family efflux transporter MFP subunit
MKYLARLVPALAIGLVGGAFYLLNSPSREGSAGSSADQEMAVRVAQVQRVSIPVEMRLSGQLQPIDQAEIVSRLAGKVTEVRFKVGDFVPSGAIVATIRANDLDQRIARIEGNIASAQQELRSREDQLAQAEKRLAQDREFFQRDLIARRDVEQAEIAAETARAQAELAQAHVAQQEAMLAQLRALQNLTRLSAPISGQVSRRLVETGAVVGEGTAIIAVANLDTLKLNASVSGAVVSGLRPGLDVQITTPALPGVISKGKIIRFEPQKKSGVGSIGEVEIQVSNQQRKLLPGMLVEASLDLNSDEKILLVPRSAVASENQVDYVYKVAAGRATRQQVVLGWERGEEVTVVQGLKEGESIAVDITKIPPGARVRALNVQLTPGQNGR